MRCCANTSTSALTGAALRCLSVTAPHPPEHVVHSFEHDPRRLTVVVDADDDTDGDDGADESSDMRAATRPRSWRTGATVVDSHGAPLSGTETGAGREPYRDYPSLRTVRQARRRLDLVYLATRGSHRTIGKHAMIATGDDQGHHEGRRR